MTTYAIEKTVQSKAAHSPNVAAVNAMFGLSNSQDKPIQIIAPCNIQIFPGQITYITGGSGAGKSLIMTLLKEQMTLNNQQFLDLNDLTLSANLPLVDAFGNKPLQTVLKWLAHAGLSDAFAISRIPEQLSDGQRYRFKLALAMANQSPVIFADEFCNTLDRITAAVVAHNTRKVATLYQKTFILATSHDDLLEDLAPDVVVIKHLGSDCEIFYPATPKPITNR